VVFLSAAENLLQNMAGVVLLAATVPGLLLKMTVGFWADRVSYNARIAWVCMASSVSFFIASEFHSTAVRVLGIVLMSLAGSLGEATFLALTSHFNRSTIGMWSSGTGGAGIVGAGSYVALTDWLGLSSRNALRFCGPTPLISGVVYFFIVNRRQNDKKRTETRHTMQFGFTETRQRLFASMLYVFIIPLMMVYYAEYTINQGILPTLDQFPSSNLTDSPILYARYQVLYQIGVFLSRSSVRWIQIPSSRLWLLPVLQFLNLAILMTEAVFRWTSRITIIYAFILWEGLLGGAAYVNSFDQVSQTTPKSDREWALSVATVGDGVGVLFAAITDSILECSIRKWQDRPCPS